MQFVHSYIFFLIISPISAPTNDMMPYTGMYIHAELLKYRNIHGEKATITNKGYIRGLSFDIPYRTESTKQKKGSAIRRISIAEPVSLINRGRI